ncbi:unnamed protein product [Callosobruchus maculatus]|uniref:Uncharacterized protein n=1 Tax=Callosobruchus maculatus TaxID=64391 RepID=A0A653DP79_CALMS|nr:unnamed protein product [Callosobruchus maculatus]
MFNTVSISVVFIFSCLFLFNVHAQEDLLDELKKKPGYEKCLKSSGLDVSTIRSDPDSQEALCFSKCLIEEKGVLHADGTLDLENMFDAEAIKKLKPELIAKIEPMKECLKPVVIKKCEDMLKVVNCSKSFIDEKYA